MSYSRPSRLASLLVFTDFMGNELQRHENWAHFFGFVELKKPRSNGGVFAMDSPRRRIGAASLAHNDAALSARGRGSSRLRRGGQEGRLISMAETLSPRVPLCTTGHDRESRRDGIRLIDGIRFID